VHNPMRTVVNSIKEEMEEMKMEEEAAKAAVNAEFADFARYDDVEVTFFFLLMLKWLNLFFQCIVVP